MSSSFDVRDFLVTPKSISWPKFWPSFGPDFGLNFGPDFGLDFDPHFCPYFSLNFGLQNHGVNFLLPFPLPLSSFDVRDFLITRKVSFYLLWIFLLIYFEVMQTEFVLISNLFQCKFRWPYVYARWKWS